MTSLLNYVLFITVGYILAVMLTLSKYTVKRQIIAMIAIATTVYLFLLITFTGTGYEGDVKREIRDFDIITTNTVQTYRSVYTGSYEKNYVRRYCTFIEKYGDVWKTQRHRIKEDELHNGVELEIHYIPYSETEYCEYVLSDFILYNRFKGLPEDQKYEISKMTAYIHK